MHRAAALLMLPLVGALGACTTDNPAFVAATAACEAGETFVLQEFGLQDANLVDILFVIDNHSGMLSAQQALGRAMPAFVDQLNASPLQWRLAVTSTDSVNDRGNLLTGLAGQTGCPATRPAVLDNDTQNAGVIASCNVVLGESGDPITQGLRTARIAIDTTDNGFSRPDARLVVVFFSSKDDCTPGDGFDRSNPENCYRSPQSLQSLNTLANYFSESARRLDANTRAEGNPVSIFTITPPAGPLPAAGSPLQPVCTGLTAGFVTNRYTALTGFSRLARHSAQLSFCNQRFDDALTTVFEVGVLAPDDELCTAVPMNGAPQAVIFRSRKGAVDEYNADPFGEYLVEGRTDRCPNGAVALSADARGARRHAEVWFCTDSDNL